MPIDRILAKPPVRKLARDLGIALADVFATGPDGTVTRADVLAAQQRAMSGGAPAGAVDQDGEYFPQESPQAPEGLGGAMKTTRDQPFAGVTSDERTTRVPIRSVRKRTAEAMVASAFTAPHVTVFNEIDMTRTVQIISDLKSSREWKDIKVSPLVVIAKALLVAIRRNPEVNASWDEQAQEIVYKHFVNLGIAAATPRGLIVPNLKDAHLMTLRELAEGIDELARTARAGRTSLSDTREGTITVTNFGVFGIDSGTPILNPGESVILGVGAIKEKPWVVDGRIEIRRVAQLALSFDHRLIDGALGSGCCGTSPPCSRIPPWAWSGGERPVARAATGASVRGSCWSRRWCWACRSCWLRRSCRLRGFGCFRRGPRGCRAARLRCQL